MRKANVGGHQTINLKQNSMDDLRLRNPVHLDEAHKFSHHIVGQYNTVEVIEILRVLSENIQQSLAEKLEQANSELISMTAKIEELRMLYESL